MGLQPEEGRVQRLEKLVASKKEEEGDADEHRREELREVRQVERGQERLEQGEVAGELQHQANHLV